MPLSDGAFAASVPVTPPRRRGWVLPGLWVAVVAGCELLGRRSPSDAWDAIGVFALTSLAGVTAFRLRRAGGRAPQWIARAWSAVRDRVRGWWPQSGVDLRGTPPLPRGFPPTLLAFAAIVAGTAIAAFLARGWFPGPVRAGALFVSPTLTYLGLGAVWTLLLGLLFAGGFFAWLDLHDALWNGEVPAARRRWIEGLTGVAWLALIVVLVIFVPVWLSWALATIALIVGTAAGLAVNRYEPLRFVWRMRAGEGPRVFTAGEGIGWNCLIAAGLFLIAAITTAGVGRGGRLAETMPLTIGLGSAAAWATAIAFTLWVVLHLARPAWLSRSDPARPQPAVLRLADPGALAADVARELRERGFRPVETAAPSDALGVRVDLDPSAPARVEGADTVAPRIRVRPAALLHAATLAELRRADTRLRRASLIEGLRKLLDLAATRRFDRGSGFWIAPHLWYVIGMTRDEDDGDFWTLGPPYHKLFPVAARQHLHQVLRALEVDLVFLEDGVAFDDFEAVLKRLFDVYDVLGPQTLEEKDFVGLVRVSVMIHDLTIGEPLDREGYPEPSYEEIGRARILHIMKDRGDGDEERDPLPVTPEEQPVLAPAG